MSTKRNVNNRNYDMNGNRSNSTVVASRPSSRKSDSGKVDREEDGILDMRLSFPFVSLVFASYFRISYCTVVL